ncbi:MAG: ABC transporter substrate-binding protein [Gemmatimonadetes bacterium]|nr:ABC transporter substrate-binding protein [Gemmatimonadota bacterium]MBT5448863.1 ABC transporter substrate-binding protein [Gemmatimonadota bacterium]MBT5800811.1 ABC transporter substrate-binding protein [Gemmatimonadota bacterium]MBT6623431.1 ABC transporter substrate-binding protein [Gemmatimonadota bacterium]MBT6902894.1 ABC transporter substrate-binding protein [Gemmatimonadota bacterium]
MVIRTAEDATRAVARAPAPAGGDIPQEAWPKSWFQPPRKASEVGLVAFRQAPMLAALVAAGELPPVEERLPDDPMVVVPIDEIGTYGGTARIFLAGESLINVPEGLLRPGPQMRLNLPNWAEKAEYSNGARTLNITLRPGHRWSDGHLLTADDYLFFFEHFLMNKDLTPVVEPRFKGARIEKHDAHSFSYHFPQPMPLFVNHLAHNSSRLAIPAHFMKRYHPSFTDRAQLEDEAEELGLQDWRTYLTAVNATNDLLFFGRPVLTAYVLVSRTSTRTRLRRNPYYPKVDPEGNQLPYIDYLEVQRVDSAEIMAAKASTGQVDFAGRQFMTADIPLFKRFEKKNGYSTYIWARPYGSDVVLQFNLNHRDEGLRKIFQDVRFRRAMSLAINREEVNDIVYFGQGVPRQLTVVPSSRYFEPEFAAAWAEFDPVRAGELFDEMGLVDRDGDGTRERLDGEALQITLEYMIGETPKQITLDLVTAYWREVGVSVNLKQISGPLQAIRAKAGLMDMTIWHADRNTDILFPIEPYWYVPVNGGWEQSQWSSWRRWYFTDGTRGSEPPKQIKQLLGWWENLRRATDEKERIEMGKKILRSQAENLWALGVIGLGPHPIIVSDRLRNVPHQGYWGWDSRWSWPYYPETWSLNQEIEN